MKRLFACPLCLLPLLLSAALLSTLCGADGPWMKLEAADFTIYSDGKKAEIETCAVRYAGFRSGFSALFLRPGQELPVSTLILFQKEKSFYAAIAPSQHSNRTSAKLYYSCEIDGRPTVALPLTAGDESLAQTFLFETTFALAQLGHRDLVWMEQGLGVMMTSVEVRKGKCLVGGYGEHTFNDGLAWPDFFAANPAVYGMTGNVRGLHDYSGQAWGLMHWIIFDGPGGLDRMEALERNPDKLPPVELVASVMHTPPEKFTAAIKHHFKPPLEMPFDELALRASFKWSVVPPAEVLVQKSDLLIAAGYTEPAASLIEEARRTAPNLPAVIEADARRLRRLSLGDQSIERYRAAIDAGSQNAFAYLQSAGQRLAALDRGEKAGAAAAAERELAAREIRTAIRLNPRGAEPYQTLAALFSLTPNLDAAALVELDGGVRPDTAGLGVRYQRAVLRAKIGDNTGCLSDLREIVNHPASPADLVTSAHQLLVRVSIAEAGTKIGQLVAEKSYEAAYELVEAGQKEADPQLAAGYNRVRRWLDKTVSGDNEASEAVRQKAGAGQK